MKEKKPINIQIGQRIKQVREAAGITQEQFAECIDVSVQFTSDLERGVVGMSIATLIKVCETLHIPSDYLLFGKTTTEGNSLLEISTTTLTSEEISMLNQGISLLLKALRYKG